MLGRIFGDVRFHVHSHFCFLFVAGMTGLIWWQWRARNPIMNLKLFMYKNFAICCLLMILVGGVLNAVTVLEPQFLQQVKGYTATLAGQALMGGGVALLEVSDDREISLTHLVEAAGLSAAHLCNAFRHSTGKSPHQFVMHARIERAEDLIKRPGLRVIDAVIASGFKNPQHLLASSDLRATSRPPNTKWRTCRNGRR